VPMIRAMEAEADGKVIHIDGAAPIDEVHQKIVASLDHSEGRFSNGP
jgi:hypothetical protein